MTPAFAGSNPAIPAILSEYDSLAQSAEQLPFKQWVRGSNPRRVTKKKDTLRRVLLFGFRRLKSASTLLLKMRGANELPLRQGFGPKAQNACTAQKRRPAVRGPVAACPQSRSYFLLKSPGAATVQGKYRLKTAVSIAFKRYKNSYTKSYPCFLSPPGHFPLT